MNKYQNGKIYKITSKQTDDIYIGSTIQTLNRRFTCHKTSGLNYCSKKIIQYEDTIIELIELYPCETKQELLWRERYWIENVKCVNKRLPIISKHEIELKAIEKSEYHKVYREKNKERLLLLGVKYREKVRHMIRMANRFKYTEFGKLCKMY